MSTLKKAWSWCARNIVALLAAIVAILGAFLFWKHQKSKVDALKDQLEVQRALKDIEGLHALRDRLLQESTGMEEEVSDIDEQIVKTKRELVELHDETRDLTAEEIIARFDQLGF